MQNTKYVHIFATSKSHNINMALIIYKNEGATKLKATVHKTGKLGFTEATAKYLGLKSGTKIQFATDSSDDSCFYLINRPSSSDDLFEVKGSGAYFSVNIKSLLDKRGVDYTNQTVIYDMEREDKYPDIEIYKLKERILPRKQQ